MSANESKQIANAIRFFKYGKFSERKEYVRHLRDGVWYDGFFYQQETWCYLVWKPTDINKQPEYKGERLLKIVPDVTHVDVEAVLNAQAWTYV